MSNSLDPDQARRFVGPDLCPNCLQRLSADDTSRQRDRKHFPSPCTYKSGRHIDLKLRCTSIIRFCSNPALLCTLLSMEKYFNCTLLDPIVQAVCYFVV